MHGRVASGFRKRGLPPGAVRDGVQEPPGVFHVVGVGGGAVVANAPVAGAGQGDEHRRAERLAVRRSVGLADRPAGDRAARQVRGVLTAAGGAVPPASAGPEAR